METGADKMATPQLGSPALTVCFSALLAVSTAIAAGLYCLAVQALSELGLGAASYTAALLLPILIGVGAALATIGPANRRFRKLRQAFQTIIDGDLSVRLPEKNTGIFRVAYSDFNRMAQELEKVRAMREEYVNTFTHEFKTPLTAIRGFAELLQEPGFTEEEQKKYLHIIASETCQLAELANDALLLTKLETQNLPVVREKFWLDEQVSHDLTMLEGSLREKNQNLTVDIAPVELYGSKELLSHVWTNLIGNAIKYTPNGGQISVSLKREGSEAVFTVTDNGIGMSEEVKAHIFDRYYQADPPHTRKGIGLGLPIVHKILELCGGKIDVESRSGEGSTFRVHLPVNL